MKLEKFYPRKLYSQIAVLVSVIIFVVFLAFGSLTARKQVEFLQNTVKESSVKITESLAESCTRYLLISDYAGLDLLLKKFMSMSEALHIQVLRTDGKILSEASKEQEILSPIHPSVDVRGEGINEAIGEIRILRGRMTIVRPVISGKVIGWVSITYSLRKIDEMHRRIWIETGVFAMCWTLVGIVMLMTIFRHFTGAVQKLSNFARRLGDLKGEQIHIQHSSLEIQQLTRSLNYASSDLYSKELELKSYREHLETLVETRTAQLQEEVAERRKTEEVLKESEEKFSLAFNRAPVMASISVIEDGTFMDVNDKFLEISGFTREELLGRTSTEVGWFLTEDRRRLMEVLQREDKVSGMEITSYSKDGSPLKCLYHLEQVTISGVKRLLSMAVDITERKRAEQALRESEEFKKAIFDSVSSHIAVLDGNGLILAVNDPWANFSIENSPEAGLPTCHTEPGVNYLEVCRNSSADSDEAMAAHDGILAVLGGSLPSFTLEYPCHSPVEQRWFIMNVTPLGTRGKGVVVSHADITQRILAEEALRESQARLDLALRSAHMGVWSWDIREDKRYFDQQVHHLLGIDPDEFTGTSEEFFQILHPNDRMATKAALQRVVAEECPYENEYRAVWPEGSVHFIRARGRLYRDDTGNPKVINGVVWDITERRKAEQEKEKLEARLRQAQKLEAIGTLAGGIAHDFNNILGAILGYTEITLEDIPENTTQHQDLKQVLKAAHRAKDLVKQILAFSRQGEAQARKPLEIAPIIKEALRLLRSTLPATIDLQHRIPEHPLWIKGDPTQLHQIALNLCTNAAHAMRERGGRLEVSIEATELDGNSNGGPENLKPGSYARMTVKDTGHGMDADTMKRIFDPYFTTKGVGEGSGLGLAVVDGIVRRHEGAILVRSKPGNGTSFEILLPRIEVKERQSEGNLQATAGGSERILFVEDEEALAALGERMLFRLGYRVTTRMNGLDAIELFRADPDAFDLVITDYTMPHMTGTDLAKEILQVRSDIPIMLCTGYSEMVSDGLAKKMGIQAFIMKPLSLQILARSIRDVLDTLS